MGNPLNYPPLNPDKWIDLYADILFSYAIMRVNKRETAEDLVQETFLAAYKAKDSFLQEASEKTWLIAILKRKIIDYYRKKSTQNELNVFDRNTNDNFINHFFETESRNEGHWADTASPTLWSKTFETEVEAGEFNNILKNCLSKLPEKYRAVFVLKNMEDLDSEEICKELNITASNYWTLMHRAKLQLRECLEKNYFKQ